jgi:AcrR family transcriptional regulator
MARWEPGASERLQVAALELFGENGYEQVTIAEIARLAGVTERTFYRYFGDKREVLFAGAAELEATMVDAVARTSPPADAARLAAVALDALGSAFPAERRAPAHRRERVLASQPALRERELLKLASLAQAMAAALVSQGIDVVRAAVAAESAIAVFRVGLARWLADGEERSLVELQRDTLAALRAVVMWV